MTTVPIRNAVEGMVVILRFCRAKGQFDVNWIVKQANLQTEILNCDTELLIKIGSGYEWQKFPIEKLAPIMNSNKIESVDLYNFVQQKLYPSYLKKEESINYE